MKELLELKDEILKIFQTDIEHLGDAVMETVMSTDEGKYDAYLETVDGDMYTDYMQMIFQYYLADRKDKKQDYTPKSIAEFIGALIGSSDKVVDMCAGSGALTIQKWMLNPNQQFDLYELDERVIPFLLFNLAVRNIEANVFRADVLQEEVYEHYKVMRGVRYGNVACIKSTV